MKVRAPQPTCQGPRLKSYFIGLCSQLPQPSKPASAEVSTCCYTEQRDWEEGPEASWWKPSPVGAKPPAIHGASTGHIPGHSLSPSFFLLFRGWGHSFLPRLLWRQFHPTLEELGLPIWAQGSWPISQQREAQPRGSRQQGGSCSVKKSSGLTTSEPCMSRKGWWAGKLYLGAKGSMSRDPEQVDWVNEAASLLLPSAILQPWADQNWSLSQRL